jgi:hypothetical protein
VDGKDLSPLWKAGGDMRTLTTQDGVQQQVLKSAAFSQFPRW